MKLLIVDDEEYTREGLAEEISNKLYGFSEIQQAEDGKNALMIAKSFQPDIVLTDIRMPGMDGIAFAKDLEAALGYHRLIFMSGYMEINYLKSAIELQAVSFIEKPIDEKKLDAALNSAICMVREYREQQKITIEKKQWQKRRLSELIVSKNPDVNEVEGIFTALGWPSSLKFLVSVLMKKTGIPISRDERILTERYFVKKGFYAICEDLDEETCMLLTACPIQRLQALSAVMKQFPGFNADYAVGVAGPVSNPLQLHAGLEEAKRALTGYFYQPEISYFESCSKNAETQRIAPTIYLDFIRAYREHPGTLKEWLSSFYQQATDFRNYPSSQMKRMLLSFAAAILNDDPDLYAVLNEICSANELEYLFLSTCTFSQLQLLLDRIVDAYVDKKKAQDKHSYVIRSVLQLISEHFAEESFQVQAIADMLHFSPTYLNILFKREMNVSIKTYLSDYRLIQAERLLRSSHVRIADIARMCGYSSSNYFNKAFKEKYGMTPTTYRKR